MIQISTVYKPHLMFSDEELGGSDLLSYIEDNILPELVEKHGSKCLLNGDLGVINHNLDEALNRKTVTRDGFYISYGYMDKINPIFEIGKAIHI